MLVETGCDGICNSCLEIKNIDILSENLLMSQACTDRMSHPLLALALQDLFLCVVEDRRDAFGHLRALLRRVGGHRLVA